MKKDFVVLLHGILRSKLDMLPLEKFLEKNGFETINILYPSREMSLEEITSFVKDTIEEHISQSHLSSDETQGASRSKTYASDAATLSEGKERRLNFVTHSMGGLIARYFIATHKPENLGKVVMLGPPNTGSEFADFLNDNKWLGPIFRSIFGPASAQLKTNYKHIDGDITYPLGIIAGSTSINPLAPWILDGQHDGIVPVERTKIAGMSDHIVIPANHSFMMFSPDVMKQTLYFLENSAFKHD
ncbi:MAG: alpha/beta hydrolase [Rhodospirillales bacterium]|nr:alpha/beta hydrolase [Alphaproteobacteria bacterium]MCB9981313.1 alpha/beta hydrolase [Rhodospirillales bacterium]